MSRRNFDCVQPMGLITTVFAVSALVITAGLLWTSVPAYATERGEERKDARDTKQTGREDAREQKAECKAGDDKSRAECRQEKRDTKQDARESARDIKRK
jgi:hypothetical protein